ncbi:DNA repair protein RecN [Saccharicrinis aurantiacus]|uniref:DNA repair protein RecN n=1 Tax=Saccharicrinis aurantiacus TaxID=1849719 RepID=UPI0024919457|nr:DNA repair protein RecN [Saccharicrinis aurantiacus]
MLKSLLISNYALIDKIEIDFQKGFSVITGETGAGKSIMLGALSLVLGQRSDLSVLKNKEKKSVIEAVFDIKDHEFRSLFEVADVDYEEETTIRREILTSGKSRAFVNDTPVNLNFLKSISVQLIDIHSQHQNLLLGDTKFQLNIIDAVAQNTSTQKKYQEAFKGYKKLQKEKQALELENSKLKDDTDYIQFQYDQIHQLNLQSSEQSELETSRDQLSHAEEIKGALFETSQLLNGDTSALEQLKSAIRSIERVASYLSEGSQWLERLNSSYIDLEDLISEIETKEEGVEYDPQKLEETNARLTEIYNLQQKHKVSSVSDLLEIQNAFEEQLGKVASFDVELEKKEKEIIEAALKLGGLAEKLTKSRKKVFSSIEKTLSSQLKELGMPNARLVINYAVLEEFSDSGLDDICFLFSANKQGELAEIPKVASGGEMSRVMLCIKSLLSISRGLPTIIFDEIDTGVSGEVADKMGVIMQEISKNIQVLSITHLPQIAVKGQQHYKVYKSDTKDATHTSIVVLSYEDRVKEVAKMLSGSSLSEAALSNAEELLSQSL